jgi:hypothetical protein
MWHFPPPPAATKIHLLILQIFHFHYFPMATPAAAFGSMERGGGGEQPAADITTCWDEFDTDLRRQCMRGQ